MNNQPYQWTDLDNRALDIYNAAWRNPITNEMYKGIGQAATRAGENGIEHIRLMNLAIDAALELCGHQFYTGRPVSLLTFAASVSETCLFWAECWLMLFVKGGD